MAVVIQQRRDLAANWVLVNPILHEGEWGLEMDVYPYKVKIGDGVTPWNALAYWVGPGGVLSVTGTAGRITSTGGFNPIIDIDAAYVGQASITTLGTIATGVWQATPVTEVYGGTGQNAYTTGDILYASAPNVLSKLPIGLLGEQLTVSGGGVPFWSPTGTGTVTSVSVVNANGFNGTVATATTTPAITITTTVTGVIKGNGTAISAALDTDITAFTLTGFVSGAGVVGAADSILSAIEKLDGNIIALVTGVSSVSGTLNRIVVAPTTGAVVVDIDAAYVGQASITTTGTLTSGATGAGFTLALTLSTITGVLTEIHGGTNQSTYTLGDTLYSSAANTLSKLAGNTVATKMFLSQTGTGAISAAPVWATVTAGDIGSGQILSKTDDTNVTLTLGGSPLVALLAATSLTLGWTGLLAGSRGGTGVNNGAFTFTYTGNTTITGGGTVALGGFTLTVPATGTTALGTGTNTQVAFWSGTNTVSSSSQLTYTTATATFSTALSTNGVIGFATTNGNAGAATQARYFVSNNTSSGAFTVYGTGFTTAGLLVANLLGVVAGSTVGLLTTVTGSAGKMWWAIGGTAAANEIMRLTTVGLSFTLADPTAIVHLKAGTTAASTAPLKFTSGTNMTTAEAGAMEYDGTNLFFTRTGTTRQTVLTANVKTTEVVASDTTVTVNIAGVDIKLLAKA